MIPQEFTFDLQSVGPLLKESNSQCGLLEGMPRSTRLCEGPKVMQIRPSHSEVEPSAPAARGRL